MKRILPGFLTAAVLSLAVLGNAYLTQAQPPAPPAPPSAEDYARLKQGFEKQAAELADLKAAAAKQQPAPMPVGGGAAPVKAPPVGKGRGYVPLTPAKRAALHAQAKANHDGRLAALAKFQTLPAAFDIREKGWGMPVGDQADCGSCYLCSTCLTASAAFVKAGYGKPDGSLNISWQYGMDCHDFGGCGGGNGTEVIDWMCSNGFPADSWVDTSGTVHHDYPPYEARSRTCRKVPGAKLWKPASWGFCTPNQENRKPTVDEIKTAMFNFGMLNIAIDAGGDFGGGTDTLTILGDNIDHEINVPAWDDNHDNGDGTKGAFLLQNQWAKDWGINGCRWVSYKAAAHIVDWFWVTATPLPPPPVVTVAAPSLIGGMFADAKAACAAVGLTCDLAVGSDVTQPIVSQTPAAGVQVATGSTVTVTTGIAPPLPPDPGGDIVVRIPAGSVAGNYVAISTADAAALRAKLDEINAILNGTGGTDRPPPIRVPDGWEDDVQIMSQIGKAMEGHGIDRTRFRALGAAGGHPIVARMVYHKMRTDPAGAKLIKQYKPGALPAGFLTNLLDWLVKNGPQLIALIETIMKLFGL